MADLATTIAELSRAAGESVQIQYMPHPDWAEGFWVVYVGLRKAGASTDLGKALAQAGAGLAAKLYAKEG